MGRTLRDNCSCVTDTATKGVPYGIGLTMTSRKLSRGSKTFAAKRRSRWGRNLSMALLTVKRRFELERTCVLAPELSDPRRESLRSGSLSKRALPLGNIAQVVRQTVSPAAVEAVERRYVVLDTSDAREG